MIIFGWRGVTFSAGSGSFFCPSCADQRDFDKKSVRQFFTLYFIPIIPLQKLGEYVQCRSCRKQFRPEVLGFDPRQAQADFNQSVVETLRKTIAFAAAIDSSPTRARLEAAESYYNEVVGKLLPGSAPPSVETRAPRREDLLSSLGAIAPNLSDEGKEMILRAVVRIAGAEGPLSDNSLAFIQSAADAIHISPTHLRGILAAAK